MRPGTMVAAAVSLILSSACSGTSADPTRTAAAHGPDTTTSRPAGVARPLFHDEFDGSGSPNPWLWTPVVERRHASYQTARLKNLRVEGGNLVIEAHREPYKREAHTSAMIKSRRSFRSGRFEARMKLPAGKGTWPAFWLIGTGGSPGSGEIDVVEHYARAGTGDNTYGIAYSTLHSAPPSDDPGNTARGRVVRTRLDPTAWHVYEAEWRADEIRFSIDGELTGAFTRPADDPDGAWPFDDHPERIAFDLFLGAWAGPVDEKALPQQLLVDWVRVWPVTPR